MKYVYPAVMEFDEGAGYSVYFPDIDSAITSGETLYEALYMAEDALGVALMQMEKRGKTIPQPTELLKVKVEGNEFATLIKVDTDVYKKSTAADAA